MKVILCEDVEHLGEMGQTVKVAPGYARNFLLPRRLAVGADSASAKQIEHELKILKRREEKRRTELKGVAKNIESLTIEIKMRAGEGDKLFGSVTTALIAEHLAEAGHAIEKKTIKLEEPIKQLGMYLVPVKLGAGVEAQVKVWVTGLTPEGESTPAADTAEEAAE